MLDDREPAIRSWAAGLIADLPQQMRTELDAWFEVMANGSSSAPRRRPRSETTIRLHLRWAIPALTAWASAGHNSLREITPEHIRAALPPSGNPRSTMGAGLRSIFSVLKTRKLIFTNPIGRIRTGTHERRQPLPLETAVIRDALLSPNTARAALAALTAFHALRAGELRNARVTDAHDGRLQVGQRSIPLAEPARVRISAWLTYRDQCWPDTANPHLFLNHWNATRTDPVGQRWLGLTLGMPARVLREDRILHEIHTSGGDVRRVCDLFGLTVGAALRYLPNLLP
jgi:integrase